LNLCGYWAGMTFYPYGAPYRADDGTASFNGLYGERVQHLYAFDTETTYPPTYNPELYFGCNTISVLYPAVYLITGGMVDEEVQCLSYYGGYQVVAEAQGNYHRVFSFTPTGPNNPPRIQMSLRLAADPNRQFWAGTLVLTHLPPWPPCQVTYDPVTAIPDPL